MSDELNWNFADKDDAKAETQAAVEYLLNEATGGARGDIVEEIIAIVRDAANGLPARKPDPLDDDRPGGLWARPTHRLIVAGLQAGKRILRGAYSLDGQSPWIAPTRRSGPDRWEWRVFHGDTPIKVGYALSRETAQIEADRALSRLLSEGQP
jgi:hypothetical protein